MKGVYQHIRQVWKRPKQNLDKLLGPLTWRNRLAEWRAQSPVLRLEYPTRLDRARSLGYKAKQGYIIVRSRVTKGGSKRERITGGRRPKRYGRLRFTPGKSLRWIAEERAARRYPNLEVLNSYFVGEDGQHKWYEVILIDKSHPAILKDRKIGWIASPANRSRVFRGLTSAGKKSRGLVRGGRAGQVKSRPSIRASGRRGK